MSDETRCPQNYKRKTCGRALMEGKRFCVFHAESDLMRKCEICSAVVKLTKFEKHITRSCPIIKEKAAVAREPYFKEDLNSGSNAQVNFSHRIHKDQDSCISLDAFRALQDKIQVLHASIEKFPTEIGSPTLDISDIDRKESKKHYEQHKAIMAHIESFKGLSRETALIELGAGKAELSRYIYTHIHKSIGSDLTIIPIDMAAFRHKADTILRSTFKDIQIKRITINIKDLDLSGIKELERKQLLFATKHLCGSGLDFAIRCLESYFSNENNLNRLSGIALASCCHGKCSWSTYSNQSYFTNAGFSPQEFSDLCHISSWATTYKEEHLPSSSDIPFLYLSPTEKQSLGRKCKQLIDSGRCLVLQKLFKTKIVEYIDPSITPENHLLIGRP